MRSKERSLNPWVSESHRFLWGIEELTFFKNALWIVQIYNINPTWKASA